GKTGESDQITNKDAIILYCLTNGINIDYASSAKDQNPSQPPASTSVVIRFHKEDQQATGSPTYLGVTSKERSHPQLSSDLTAKVDLGKSAHNDSISKQQDMNKGAQNYSLDHMFAGTNPSVLVNKTKSTRDGLKTTHTKIGTNFESSKTKKKSKADKGIGFGDDEFNTSPDISSSNDTKKEIKLRDLSKLVQDVGTDFIDLDSPEDDKPIIVQDEINDEVMLKSSLPTKLKELPSKFNELTGKIKELKKHVYNLEIELLGDLKEISTKLETFTSTIKSLTTQAKIKTLDDLPSLLNKVTDALNKFAQVVEKSAKDAEKDNVNKPIPTTTSIIPPIITTTITRLQSPFLLSPRKSSSQPEGELIKKDKSKEAMSSKDTGEEGAKSDFDDDTINLTGFIVESSKKKKMKKFDFVTKGCEHVHLTKEQIKEQKRIEKSVKADAAKQEVKARKEEWVDPLGVDVESLITLKVYREDGTDKVISNFKASDLHLGE
nr:hypothetical protein [Tanacetum cinerariifolium]